MLRAVADTNVAVSALLWRGAPHRLLADLDAGRIKITLLDCAKWLHKAGGMSKVAQIARTLGEKARPARLAALARSTGSADARRLGYLLELAGHEPQAKALDSIAQQAKTPKLLDPTSKTHAGELSGRWKITVNWPK